MPPSADPAVLQQVQSLARRAEGDPTTGAELLALLRQHPNVLLFNTALEAAPQSMTMPLVELLCAGGHAGGTAWPKPGKDTGMVVLERASQQDLDSAMRRLLYAGMQPHYRVMLAWASCHARRGSVQGVRHVMQLVQEAHGTVAPHYYVQLIRAYCTRGRWKNAEGVLGEMRQQGVAPTEQVFRTLIFCLGQHHRADCGQRMFDEMVAMGLEPSMATRAALLNAYAESRQPQQAVEVLLSMRRQGITPSVQAYGALTKAFARSGDWRRAYETLELMQSDGVLPNEQVFGSIIEAAAVAGKPSVACELLRRMRGAGIAPNVIVYTSLLSSYGATGDVAAAEGVLREMEASGCRPNAKTYTELMAQLAAKGRYDECEAYFNRMVAAGCAPDKVSSAIFIDSLLHRWAACRQQQQHLLDAVQARWDEAAGPGGTLAPNTFLHEPQGRLTLDLHGYSVWTAQLAVLATLGELQQQHREQAGVVGGRIARLDVITGRGNRSERRQRSMLRELVLEMLQRLVAVSFPRGNDGLLVVEAKELRRLFDELDVARTTVSLRTMQHCLVDPNEV